MTVGIDDYHSLDEQIQNSNAAPMKDTQKTNLANVKLDLLNNDDFDRVVSKLEIFVLSDKSIFEKDY